MDYSELDIAATYKLGKLGVPLGIIFNILRREKYTWVALRPGIAAGNFSKAEFIGVRLYNKDFTEDDYKEDFGGGKGPRIYHRFVRYNRLVTNVEVHSALCKSFGVDPTIHKLCCQNTDSKSWGIKKGVKFWDKEETPAPLCSYHYQYYIREKKDLVKIFARRMRKKKLVNGLGPD